MGKIIKMTLEEVRAHAKTPAFKAQMEKLRNMRDEDIDFSDIPEFTPAELKRFRRVGHGGARAGAGRKPADTKPLTLHLPESLIASIRKLAAKERKTLSNVVREHLVGV